MSLQSLPGAYPHFCQLTFKHMDLSTPTGIPVMYDNSYQLPATLFGSTTLPAWQDCLIGSTAIAVVGYLGVAYKSRHESYNKTRD